MFGRKRPRVLVAGAGPAGLLGALCLSELQVHVQVIDPSPADEALRRRNARGAVTMLYPRSLDLLSRHGVAAPLLADARIVRTIGVYGQGERIGEISFERMSSAQRTGFPFAAIVPVADLERCAVQVLRQRHVDVFYERQLASIEQGTARVRATLEHLGSDSAGYAMAHGELVVERAEELELEFLLAADGHHSVTRQQLQVPLRELAPRERYEVLDGGARGRLPDEEAALLLTPGACAVVWPLPGDCWRWIVGPAPSARLAIAASAPWPGSVIDELETRAHIDVDYRVASSFGRNRIWLAGGAAHSTSPLGAQSTNIGMAEGARLAELMAGILRDTAPLGALSMYERERLEEWSRLLPPRAAADSEPRSAIVPAPRGLDLARFTHCLPASAAELDVLLEPIQRRLAATA